MIGGIAAWTLLFYGVILMSGPAGAILYGTGIIAGLLGAATLR